MIATSTMSIDEYFGDWLKVIDREELDKVVSRVYDLYQTKLVVPAFEDIFKAFTLCTLHDCKMVFLGQDPYPQKGVATGVLFGNKEGTELSPSLEVIKEACINFERPHNYPITFDQTLESWGRQGILMLNSALTCEMNRIGSHTMLWRPFISKLVYNISKYDWSTIFVLFGSQAATFEPYIKSQYVFKVQHPAYFARTGQKMPYSVFTDLNKLLVGMYGTPIQWYEEYN